MRFDDRTLRGSKELWSLPAPVHLETERWTILLTFRWGKVSTELKAVSHWSMSLLQLLLGVRSEEGRDLEKQSSYFKFLKWSFSQNVRALQKSLRQVRIKPEFLVSVDEDSRKRAMSEKTEELTSCNWSDVERWKCC